MLHTAPVFLFLEDDLVNYCKQFLSRRALKTLLLALPFSAESKTQLLLLFGAALLPSFNVTRTKQWS
jgi:hypothetical protein